MPQWPADAIERRPLATLVPYARNARTHSDEQIAQLAASITEWGWTMPILVDEGGMIIAGHGRVLAAAKLGIGEVPIMVARGWSDEQKRAYNKVSKTKGAAIRETGASSMKPFKELGFKPAIGFQLR